MEGTGQPAGRIIGKKKKAASEGGALPDIEFGETAWASSPATSAPAAAPAPADEPGDAGDRALVLLPGAEATNARAEAVAAALGLTVYEARLKLVEPLPQVLAVGPAAELEGTAAPLRAAQANVALVDAAPLTGALRPFPAERLRVEGDLLRVTGPRGEVTVDLRQPALLVAGRFEFAVRASSGFRSTQAQDYVLFGHLYAGGWADPIELAEAGLQDWDFLGPAKSPVRRANFQKTLELLRRWPDVSWDDALLKHGSRIKESSVGVPGKGHFIVTGAETVSERSNQGGADLLSRVLYQLWRARLGERTAAHDAGLTVVSMKDDAPEQRVADAFGGGPTALDLAHPSVRKAAAEAKAPPRTASGRVARTAGLIPPPDPADAAPPPGPPGPPRPSGRASRTAGLIVAPDAADLAPPPPSERRPSGRLGHADVKLAGDPTRPLRPNPPGAPPVTLVLRGLSLSAPHACVCCLAQPGMRPIEATASKTEWDNIASTGIGLFAFLATGYGWFHTQHEESMTLRMAACPACFKHETSDELAWILGGLGAIVGLVATLAKTGMPSAGTFAVILFGWLVGFLVLALALSLALSRRGATCAESKPLRLAFRGGDFKLVFGNRSYGERVAELNPELLVSRG